MNGKKACIILILSFVITTMVLFSPQASQAFWEGMNISEKLDEFEMLDLETYLEENFGGEQGPLGYPPQYSDNDAILINYGVKLNIPDKTWGEFTLISAMGFFGGQYDCTGLPGAPPPDGTGVSRCGAVLIDMEGNLINGWATPALGIPSKMLPNGDVLLGQDGGLEGILTQVNWHGERINQWGPMHHDHQREGNPVGYYAPGQFAQSDSGITMRMDREEEADRPDIGGDRILEDDLIIQEDWDGTETWRWKASDHYFADDTGNLGFGLDANAQWAVKYGPYVNGFFAHDYTHANCASWLGPNPWFKKPHGEKDYRFHPENIIADFRSQNILFIIARFDHPDGLFKEGDIVWRVGPNFTADMPEHKIGQIIGPHGTHMIPRGLPGAGNILVFDNGGMAGFGSYFPGSRAPLNQEGNNPNGEIGTYPNKFRSYSRVIEFNPITLEVVWEYLQPNPTEDLDGDGETIGNERKFFASHYSNAQRLKNGNTLVTEGNAGRVFELTPEDEVVWEYAAPPNPSGGWGMTWGDYRAYRVPASWVYRQINPVEGVDD